MYGVCGVCGVCVCVGVGVGLCGCVGEPSCRHVVCAMKCGGDPTQPTYNHQSSVCGGGGRGEGSGGGGSDCVLMTYLCRYRITSMHLIGWQNTWEQAPGVPATPSPP